MSDRNPVFSEALSDFDPDSLNPEQRRAFEASQVAAQMVDQSVLVDPDKVRAKYKIEVLFGPRRTSNGPNAVMICLWESGKRLHGGGDAAMYWCLDNRPDQHSGCNNPIPDSRLAGGVGYCPHCKVGVDAKYLTGQKVYRVTTQRLAEVITDLFRKLEHSADIYCKYHRKDIRYLAMERTYGEEKARKHRGLSIFPLKNLMCDVSNGASLEGRIRAFLSA